MKHVASATDREGNRGISDRRIAQVEPLRVPPHDLVFPGEPISPGAKVPRISELPVYPRTAGIELQSLGNQHRRALQLETAIKELRQSLSSRTFEIVQPAPVILTLE